jgi:hypothetical protein
MSPSGVPTWPREHFEPGGGDAQLFYKVHGLFTGPPEVSRERHRCEGIPAGCDLESFTRAEHPSILDFGLTGDWVGRELQRANPELAQAIAATDQCLVLRGTIPDPPDLNYFRDAVGLIAALLEGGGLAVFDPFVLKWWSKDEWLEHALPPASPALAIHTVILTSQEQGGGLWYHTRGLLKFGRPDISVHSVTPDLEEAVEELCNRFIEMQAQGAIVPEGQAVKMQGLPPGWICRYGGDIDDPDFNNRHIEIGPPPAG